jgi:hypothetical protein
VASNPTTSADSSWLARPTAAKTITETMSAVIASAGIRLRVTRSE